MGGFTTLVLIIGGIWLFIKTLPILLRFLLYCAMAIPLWFVFFIFLPGFLDETSLLVILLIIALVKSGGSRSSYSGGSSYVLNKKSGVIHNQWDPSVDTISDHHRKAISYSEAQELVNRQTRYRFKQ